MGQRSSDPNAPLNYTIAPAVGTDLINYGMFNFSVSPLKSTDKITGIQYIVSLQGQQTGQFMSFVFVGDLEPGQGLTSSILFSGYEAALLNDNGVPIIAQIAVAVNGNAYTSPAQVYTESLWPGGPNYDLHAPIGQYRTQKLEA
ncbi:hypothetical protein SAMN05216359_1075 [Roseateles sp. YR242]|uniref:hypothetical protein n=1 Tax=Roseateles sp. YR242 TaxID=1855305 RepID=UPI0008D142F4|nr:hypothetical protein [Roseateles sp. YR242]SEL26515.1 hypothetical protein SAMN05216359_1075 [Roseateles sp. YR242]